MLKRLELVGFKSFADKTVFDFGDGITAVVGPNGSGKSNIVDALRWILGEQSAKSLRGGEMADVIFNGSTARRSLGLAEVTMTFDNRLRKLPTDSEEVQITRRVYRTGEGEYLINGQLCRLKDIKDLFLGSGAGHDAYCIIEQGKVDVLLQASTKERRALFEETAGISRFKAKKIETLRKLERVDQNLQRLKDIVDEVEKQLRSVKLQASKAQRYHEYSTRLKELRLEIGLFEYHQLSEKYDAETKILEALRIELDQRAGRAGACEAEADRLEILLADLDDQLHQYEADLAQILQQIRSEESTIVHETTLSADLEKELDHTRRRLTELVERVTALAQSATASEAELLDAQAQADERRQDVRGLEQHLGETAQKLQSLRTQLTADKNEHLDQMRRAAHLQNDVVASKAHVDNLRRERDRLHNKSSQAAESLATIDVELQELTQADEGLQSRLVKLKQEWTEQRQEAERLRQLRDRTNDQLATLRQERSGLASGIEVLQRLIDNHEGLGTGVREMLALVEKAEPGPWTTVLGMIADFLTVKRESAPLIDLALGDWAQHFLVRDLDQLLQALAGKEEPFTGRVSFFPLELDAEAAETSPAYAILRGNRRVQVGLVSRVRRPARGETPVHPGLVAPAEQVVSCDHPELTNLPSQLLGRTLIVHDLAVARAIAEHAPGFRFVTLQGELLEADGTLTVGAQHAGTGILSRRSEWLELKEQAARLDMRIADIELDLAQLREHGERLDSALAEKQEEIDVLTEQAADLRNRLQRHRERRQGLHEDVTMNKEEIGRLEQEIADLDTTWQEAQTAATQAETQVQLLQTRLHQAEETLRQLEQERQQRQQVLTQGQVAQAKTDERLEGLRARHQQLTRDLSQRQREQQQGQQTLSAGRERLVVSQQSMLQASSSLAQLYLDKEAGQRLTVDLIAQRDVRRQERVRLAQQAQTVRSEWRAQQENAHNCELKCQEVQHQRETLIQRLREDYQIELPELHRNWLASRGRKPPEEPEGESGGLRPPLADSLLDVQAANEEIADLRHKLSRLGSVNVEALEELQELEKRAVELQAQWEDLTSAKKSLEEIIAKINQDSRKMFGETFETIRIHFQELFRKLFGGGMADIILEEEIDILESGIEIVARPPGKELRSISLMSGGEKTLTAVALLLAVFRSKPSPFCLLDEVDAALDEANIGRFTDVLREFLDKSQFIIVTHSKKTMACADVIFGITMQESGISKVVAVRFEDWVDEGQPATRNGSANGKEESFAGR